MYTVQVRNDKNEYWQVLSHHGNLESAQTTFKIADGLLWYTSGKTEVRVINDSTGKVYIHKTTISYMD